MQILTSVFGLWENNGGNGWVGGFGDGSGVDKDCSAVSVATIAYTFVHRWALLSTKIGKVTLMRPIHGNL